jgi:16S rRNA (cytosine967-C5)-methyltransferase
MINARTLAFQLLLHVNQKPSHPDRLIRVTLERHRLLDEREKALLTELVYGTIRWQGRLDWHIDQLSRIKPDKISNPIRILLRLALYQILFLDRIPPHAAVNEAVKLARATQPAFLAGFVNGLLREAIRHEGRWNWPSEEANPADFLAVTTSHPVWFCKRCIGEMGFEEARRFCDANNEVAPLVLRVNTLKTTTSELLEKLAGAGILGTPSPYLSDSIRVSGVRMDLARLPAFGSGWFQVQDEASQLMGHLLCPSAGERVLDLCAGFGAKTTHLGILMGNTGEIVAVDEAAWKLEDLKSNAERQGIHIIRALPGDALGLDPDAVGTFDRVLLDAPCSGFGTLRRNPDIRWRRHLKDPYRFSRLQESLLRHAASLVAPGGNLVYATCTVFREENEAVVERVLEEHPDYRLDEARDFLPTSCLSLCEDGFFKSWPHRHGIDGFFGARFRRST